MFMNIIIVERGKREEKNIKSCNVGRDRAIKSTNLHHVTSSLLTDFFAAL